MAKYRKKPIVVEAIQWNPPCDPIDGLREPTVVEYDTFNLLSRVFMGEGPFMAIDTLEGPHTVSPGDWIITGVKGEKYPCKPDIFEATYEPAEDDA